MKFRLLMLGLTVSLFSTAAVAGGISIEPGMWETTMTMEMSMIPQPQVHSSTECISESELNPDDFKVDEDSPCDIADVVTDGNTVSWAIHCPSDGGMSMDGQWSMTSHGDTLTGGGSMSGGSDAMQIEMNIKWEGKRIGDCE